MRPFNECQVFELSRALLPHQKELMIELKRKRVKCAKDFSDPSNNPVNLAATHTKTKNGKVPHPDFPRVTTLRDTTESCIELYGENMAGLFDSGTALSTVPGTGKTMMALSCLVWYYNRCIREHIENPGVSMIVVPANLVNGWLKEIFINTNIPPGFVRVVTAGKDFPALDRRRPCIIIVSYSMIRYTISFSHAPLFLTVFSLTGIVSIGGILPTPSPRMPVRTSWQTRHTSSERPTLGFPRRCSTWH